MGLDWLILLNSRRPYYHAPFYATPLATRFSLILVALSLFIDVGNLSSCTWCLFCCIIDFFPFFLNDYNRSLSLIPREALCPFCLSDP